MESKIGCFAFFLADSAPVLVGKVLAFRIVNGQREIRVHWFTPVNQNIRDSASTVPFDAYCNCRIAYAADFKLEPARDGRMRRVPDEDWEKADSVVEWSKKPELNGKGKKLPLS